MKTRPWDRLLWGIEFNGSLPSDPPLLIGDLWALDLGGSRHLGEPSRALLFQTRKQARSWCKETMGKWQEGRNSDDILRMWRVRPVRVRETVTVLDKSKDHE